MRAARAAVNASKGLHAQLMTLLPSLTSAQVWALQGATMMNGVDDFPQRTEVRSRRCAAVARLRDAQGHEHALDLGDPAR
jgi:hypothetical protein